MNRGDVMSNNRLGKATSIRFTDDEKGMIKELINSFGDFSISPPSQNDVVREAVRQLYEKEVPESSRNNKV